MKKWSMPLTAVLLLGGGAASAAETGEKAPPLSISEQAKSAEREVQKAIHEGKQKAYTQMLKGVEMRLSEWKKLESGTQKQLHLAKDKLWIGWQNALNRTYRSIETSLAPEAKKAFQIEHRAWKQRREAFAQKRAAKFKGGTMEAVEYASAQAEATKARCYALVNRYMK